MAARGESRLDNVRMPRIPKPIPVSKSAARRIWLRAQRLDTRAPFGDGSEATRLAVEHLGYVQIDTINVIERSHHHILFSRIPSYQRAHLHQAQTIDKSVFEYWAHALAYIPTRDFRFFMREMKRQREEPHRWFGNVQKAELRKVLRRLRRDGPLTIRDIDDDVLVEKHHPWASRKPSKRALQLAFHRGEVTISERTGMLKTYELMERHFGWEKRPRPPSEREVSEYMLDRALRSQGIVSLDSICYADAQRKPAMRKIVEQRARRGELVPVAIEGAGKQEHWAAPQMLELASAAPANSSPHWGEVVRAKRRSGEVGADEDPLNSRLRRHPLPGGERIGGQRSPDELVHILSPFDPLIIQRKRLKLFFDYDHRFEAYVPKEKRVLGYFALPVLFGDEIVAALDLKTDRERGKLLMQKWTWVGSGSARAHKRSIEEELHRFERFQLGQ